MRYSSRGRTKGSRGEAKREGILTGDSGRTGNKGPALVWACANGFVIEADVGR
jgi:hypothetical protein